MKAKITLNRNNTISVIDKRIYGSFIEHIGRAVYGGVYEPGHSTADDMGFRQDVLEMVKKLNVPIVRYPGGNFVSGYDWEDGVGDRAERPRRLELAWGAIETNEIGIDEFQEWAKRADTEVMMAVNLGTRGPSEARDLLEYCNFPGGTKYSDMRIKNGFKKPFAIKTWCLGNEMDGPWQIGSKTAEEYARLACETAKIMKWVDSSIELVACGSSGMFMPSFGHWERTVLEQAYDHIDYLSLHAYYSNGENNTPAYFGKSLKFDEFIKTVIKICDEVKDKKGSDKQIMLSFDEWNIWYSSAQDKVERWAIAPPQLEEIYTFEDAIAVACLLITLLKNSDRIKIACLAQLVNVIAPILTQNDGGLLLQTIFYPFMYTSTYGKGSAISLDIECEKYDAADIKNIPYIESVATFDEETGEIAIFAVNRSLSDDITAEINFFEINHMTLIEHIVYECDDLKATNTFEHPEKVMPHKSGKTVITGSAATATLNKQSWNMIRFSIKGV